MPLDKTFWDAPIAGPNDVGGVTSNESSGLITVGPQGINTPQRLSGAQGALALQTAGELQSGFNAPPQPQLSGEEKAQAFFDANFRDQSGHPNT